jgi:hypothetical protein
LRRALNNQDSKRKGLAVKGGIRRRAVERRQFVGGRRPFGYRHARITEDGKGTGPLVIDRAEAAVIKRIYGESWPAYRSAASRSLSTTSTSRH